jgi:hypothetical protein
VQEEKPQLNWRAAAAAPERGRNHPHHSRTLFNRSRLRPQGRLQPHFEHDFSSLLILLPVTGIVHTFSMGMLQAAGACLSFWGRDAFYFAWGYSARLLSRFSSSGFTS